MTVTATKESTVYVQIELREIVECTHNPRRRFDEARMADLTASVREHGVLTPVLVRPLRNRGKYELAAGHRRTRAAKAAGLKYVPAIVREMDDRKFAELLNLENLQHEGLDELDEAEGFRQLRDLAGYDVAAIALKLSRSEKYVYDRLKLLDLVPAAQELLRSERINAGHAILIARLSADDQARVIDPDKGWCFRLEIPSYRGLFSDQTDCANALKPPAKREDRWGGFRSVTVRELEASINEHVRMDVARADPVYDVQAHTLFAAVEAEEVPRYVAITRLAQVPESARGLERTLCCTSWRRADGQMERNSDWTKPQRSKTCDHSIKALVVVGPGRGEVFDACANKKACRVHWPEQSKAKTASAGARASGQGERETAATKRKELEREQRKAAQEKALIKLEHIVLETVSKMALDATSEPLRQAFQYYCEGGCLAPVQGIELLTRCKDGYQAIVGLRAMEIVRGSCDSGWHDPLRDLREADALLGGGRLCQAWDQALKEVQASAHAAKRDAAKSASKKRSGRTSTDGAK